MISCKGHNLVFSPENTTGELETMERILILCEIYTERFN